VPRGNLNNLRFSIGQTQFKTRKRSGGNLMKDLIEHMAKALVDLPHEVEVAEIEGEKTTVIELKVAKEDLGKVIGKQGKTARAMRTILNAAATKLRKRAVLEILE
jgi:hypothetical protein